MAAWQVEFCIVPSKVLRTATRPLTPDVLANTRYWEGVPLPPDYRGQLDSIAPRGTSGSPELETWGEEDGNRVDVWSESGMVTNLLARVDVRRLDAKFGAGLLVFVKHLGASLVRGDGVIVEPTIGAFGVALRSAEAWRFANDPAAWLAAQMDGLDA